MPRSSKRDPAPTQATPGKTPGDATIDPRSKREEKEDAQASRQDRPGTSLPAQRERWENEGGQPGGVISSTDTTRPRKSGEASDD